MKTYPEHKPAPTQADPRANVLMTSAGIMIQAPPCASVSSDTTPTPAAMPGSKRR